MASAVSVPVTVKCRLGVDDQDVETTLPYFIETVAAEGCTHFIVHARKAWLKGLSPKENRDVPPLDYDIVRRMKTKFPALEIVLNGGLETLKQAQTEAVNLDGAMYGRAAYHNPWMLREVDQCFYGEPSATLSRLDIVDDLIAYAQAHETDNPSLKALCRHIMGLFAGQRGARLWRRTISETMATGVLPSVVIAKAANAMRNIDVAA